MPIPNLRLWVKALQLTQVALWQVCHYNHSGWRKHPVYWHDFDDSRISVLRNFSSSSSCLTLSSMDFCFSSISLRNFNASLILGLQTQQKTLYWLIDYRELYTPLRRSGSNTVLPFETGLAFNAIPLQRFYYI